MAEVLVVDGWEESILTEFYVQNWFLFYTKIHGAQCSQGGKERKLHLSDLAEDQAHYRFVFLWTRRQSMFVIKLVVSFYSVVSIKNSVPLEDTEITLNFIILVIQIKVYDVWSNFYFFVNVTFLLLTANRHCTSASLSVFKSPWTESLTESWTVISLCMKKRHSFIYINVKPVYCTFFFILIECACSSTQGMCLNRKD